MKALDTDAEPAFVIWNKELSSANSMLKALTFFRPIPYTLILNVSPVLISVLSGMSMIFPSTPSAGLEIPPFSCTAT